MKNTEIGKNPDLIWSAACVVLVDNARVHAQNWRHHFLGSEHIAMALFDDPKISSVLEKNGATIEKFNTVINYLVGVGDFSYEENETAGFTPRTRRVLQKAEHIARKSDKTKIEPREIALGLLTQETDEAGAVFELFGITAAKLQKIK